MSHPRVVLAIDCATLPASVACVADDGTLAARVHDDQQRSDAWLGNGIAQCLDAAALSPAELAGVAVAIGPGTFTGIRVGIATGLGLAAPDSLPVAGVTTLEALADIGLRRSATVVACIDARRGQVYAAIYERRDATTAGLPEPSSPTTSLPVPAWGPVVCAPAEVEAALATHRAGSADQSAPSPPPKPLALGSGAGLLDGRCELDIESAAVPLAAAIGRLALRAWRHHDREPTCWRPPEPLYLRPPDAKPPRNPLLAARRQRSSRP